MAGAGISWMYADAELSQEVDFGTIGFGALGPGAGKLGMVPQGTDLSSGTEVGQGRDQMRFSCPIVALTGVGG